MYCKKLVILIVLLSLIPVVSSGLTISSGPAGGGRERVNFQCEDGTFYGDCNEDGEICATGVNLVVDGEAILERGKEYLFLGKGEFSEDCFYMLEGFNSENGASFGISTITRTEERFVAQFVSVRDYSGRLIVTCLDMETAEVEEVMLEGMYLGVVSEDYELYRDYNYCEECEESAECFDSSSFEASADSLLIDTSYRESMIFLARDSTVEFEGILITLLDFSLTEQRATLSVDDDIYEDLSMSDEIKLENFVIKVGDFFPSEVDLFIYRNFVSLEKIFISLNVDYDLYTRESIVRGLVLDELYKYKNIFWVVSYSDLKKEGYRESLAQKFEKYLEHGGNLFVFLENIPQYNTFLEEIPFLNSLGFSTEEEDIRDIYFFEDNTLTENLFELHLEKENLLTPWPLHVNRDDPAEGVILYADSDDFFKTLVYNFHFGNSIVLGSVLNFDRKIPSEFSNQFFENIFEWLDENIEDCSNGIDDNENGLIDCEEIQCYNEADCGACVGEDVFNGECSLFELPYKCVDSDLISRCEECGCSEGLFCREDGGCGRLHRGPAFLDFEMRDYFVSEMYGELYLRVNVLEPGGFPRNPGVLTLRDSNGNEDRFAVDNWCFSEDIFSNVYECVFIIEGEMISDAGSYSLRFSLTNNDGIETLSEWYDFSVLELPDCVNINEEVGIVPRGDVVKVAFYADNYEDFETFKEEVDGILERMFDKYETFDRYRHKFDFYLSGYLEKESCETYEGTSRGLICDDVFSNLFFTKSCQEDVGVIFSKRNFRSNSAIKLSVGDFSSSEYILAHELGHNPIGLGDSYCENKRYTTPDPYPNTFETLEECDRYSRTHLGGRNCRAICGEDGYVLENMGPIMMSGGGDFSLPSQMRANWFFDCCVPDSCEDLPNYCFSNVCGSCPSDEYFDAINLAPCSEVVCENPFREADSDEDGVGEVNDCDDSDYAIHSGYPPVNFIDVGNVLSESCDDVDYNCDGIKEEECSYTPECPDVYRFRCINDYDFVEELLKTTENCCGGCSGEIGEAELIYEANCEEGVCIIGSGGNSVTCDDSVRSRIISEGDV